VPVTASNGAYVPLKRSPCASVSNDGATTSLVVDDVSPFRAGDVIQFRDVSQNYEVKAIGTIAAVTAATNTISITQASAPGIVADDPVEVAYNDRDVVLLQDTTNIQADDDTCYDTPAVGVIAGQIKAADVNMVGDWDPLLAADMPLMDFVPVEPGANDDIGMQAVRASIVQFFISDLSNIALNEYIANGFTPGFAGRIKSLFFVTGDVPASTASKDIDLQCLINTTATTGGLLTLLTASIDAQGEVCNATAITAANEFDAEDTLSIKCVEATAAFAEGNGTVCVVLEPTD